MHVHVIVFAGVYGVAVAGCSGELAQRPAATDPANVAAAETPFRRPPAFEPDPLLSPVPPKSKSPEPSPTGSEPAHRPTSTPPARPAFREPPGARTPTPPPQEPQHQNHGAMPGMQHGSHDARGGR